MSASASASPRAGGGGGGSGLDRLGSLLRERGGALAEMLDGPFPGRDSSGGGDGGRASQPALLAARGPRTSASAQEYELLVEAIYEGYLLHFGVPRILSCTDPDLGLLAGDQLYAIGLAHLVARGDIGAVAQLADVIALTALAHGAGDARLAGEVWMAGARAVGWGATPEHERAKAMVRAGDPAAGAAMRASAPVAASAATASA